MSDDWKVGLIVPLYKGKEIEQCVALEYLEERFSTIVIGRVRETTQELVGEQSGFRKGKCYVDHISSWRYVVESCLKKGKKGFAVLMDLEKAYDRTDGKGLCKVSRIYGMAGKLLRVFKCMYEDEKTAALVGDN